MSYMIEIRCCICKKYLGKKEGGNKSGIISHGYCDSCLVKVEAEMKDFSKNKKELLNEQYFKPAP